MKKSSVVTAVLLFISVNTHAHERKAGVVDDAPATSFVEIPFVAHGGVSIAVATTATCYFVVGSQRKQEDRLIAADISDLPPCEYEIGSDDDTSATSFVEIPFVVDDSMGVVL
ncbi:hypothetical protein [Stenotrophomonas maltophilia]|uniref:hypothetical protein n=1 Tax=Stenotrophomonas maltophilia TaxID=40324 RepID=UPI0011B7E9A8|nr:hypothetical protein [Stenotrophomonas maltophilia]QGL66990.1 hypothetical protein FEO86_06700 [Stenotrophomonas maltophilia]